MAGPILTRMSAALHPLLAQTDTGIFNFLPHVDGPTFLELYAGWFVELLGVAEQGWFPYLYADYDVDESHGLALSSPDERLEAAGNKPTLPPPPPGEAEDPGWATEG